jgi:hypothetical protein
MSAFGLPMIAYEGFGKEYRQRRKPLINQHFIAAIAHIADDKSNKSYLYSSKSNRHTEYARVGIIGKIGQSAIEETEADMKEKTIEQKLVSAVKTMGGIAPKFTSPGFDGMPDRLVLLPKGNIAFVEVKRYGEKPRPLQVARHGLLRRLGFKVYVLDDAKEICKILKEVMPSEVHSTQVPTICD